MIPSPPRDRTLRHVALGVGLLAALWPAIFALDVFEPDTPVIRQVTGLLIHLLPTVIVLALVLLAWRQAIAGGLALLLLSAAPFVLLSNPAWINAILAAPIALSGLAFLLSAWLGSSRRRQA